MNLFKVWLSTYTTSVIKSNLAWIYVVYRLNFTDSQSNLNVQYRIFPKEIESLNVIITYIDIYYSIVKTHSLNDHSPAIRSAVEY